MTSLDDIVARQAVGARFVITAPMLGIAVDEFDRLAENWIARGGPGFALAGVPHRTCIDGEFYINRVTVIRTLIDPDMAAAH